MGRAMKSTCRVPSMSSEFSGAELGDARRTARLQSIAEAMARSPEQSLPAIARDAAELEAFYRFFENEAFGLDDLVLPHARATAARARDYDAVLCIHDLTDFSFPLRDELRAGCEEWGSRQGFFGEVSLAVAGDGSKRPLGVLGCRTWTKAELPTRRSSKKKKKKPRPGTQKNPRTCGRTEGTRWARFAAESEALVGSGRLVHVIDREADGYPLFSLLVGRGSRFVIRVSNNRVVELVEDGEPKAVLDTAKCFEVVHQVEVPLSARRAKEGLRSHPRAARTANLTFRAGAVVLKRPNGQPAAEYPPSVNLNLVWVLEADAPADEEPVEWILATTESIACPDDVIKVIDFYKTRWAIEEFFRALKSGCAFERRQLETRGALEKVLAISLVVAWRVLLLRQESRRSPEGPATDALSELHLEVLRRTGKVALPKKPTTRDALFAVAALGGHIKNNGDPGLIVLARGMECLLERTVGWVSAMAALGRVAEM